MSTDLLDDTGIEEEDDEEDEEDVRGVGGGMLRSALRNVMR